MSSDGSSRYLQTRLEDLASHGGHHIPGIQEIANGLAQLLSWTAGEGPEERAQIEQILTGFEALTTLLEERRSKPTPREQSSTSPPAEVPPGLQQFIATFQKEAQKRVRGLSIALMGVFGGLGSDEAMDQSASHLHAIRGGAAMLGLEQVAKLSGIMERTILERRHLPPQERQWPTRHLLRAFAILQEALEAPHLQSEAKDVDQVLTRLRGTEQLEAREVPSAPSKQVVSEPPRPLTGRELQLLEKPILVVDDVETIAASVGFILSELEVPIEIARDGEEALQSLQEKPFSLVISDVAMPRMDGINLTKAIRKSPALQHLPVILLTGLDHPDERRAGLEAGATAYLIKGSIGGGELLSTVRDLLEAAPFVARPLQEQPRRILVAEDTETVAASIAFVLSEGPFEIILASDGEDAFQQLQRADFDLLLTDMQMPYMSGIELTKAVRADANLRHLPVIIFTSVQDEAAIEQARSAGVDRYLIKGQVAGESLLEIVGELLG